MAGLYEQMVEDATSFVDASYDKGFKLSPEQRDAIHLAGIRRRFTTLRHSVKALDRLATEQGINDINSLDGVVQLFRSEERRGGKVCVSTCRSRWSQEHSKKKTQI